MDIKIRKFNEKIKAWEHEKLPYDHKTLSVMFRPSSAGTANEIGAYTAPSGKIAVITAIKMIADSANTWFSFSGDYEDLHFLPAAGVDMIGGDPEKPLVVLDEGQSVNVTVTNATPSNYAVILYGMERDKKPVR